MLLVAVGLTLSAAADADDAPVWEHVEGRSNSSNGKPRPSPQPPPQTPPQTPAAETPPPAEDTAPATAEVLPTPPPPLSEGEQPLSEEGKAGVSVTAARLLQVDRATFDIPMVFNAEVLAHVEWLSTEGRLTMRRWMERSGRYKNLIQGELVNADLPTDIFYLAMVESGFNPVARSHAEAVGIWQFIAPTAQSHGLRVDDIIDERRDPVRATQAAIAYLTKLHHDLGNWHMAFAAYNAGEGLVFGAIDQHASIDYWGLARADALPEETQEYVPRILAAAIIAKHPALFGFDDLHIEPPLRLEPIEVPARTTVSAMADSASMTLEEFQALNTHILGDTLPAEPQTQVVYVPVGTQGAFLAALRGQNRTPRLSGGHRVPVEPEPVPDLSHHNRSLLYTIQEGDTLASVAQWYGIDAVDLQRWNTLDEGEELVAGQQLRTSAPRAQRWSQYTAQQREHLGAIARRHGCTVDDLRSWNGLESDVSHVDAGTVLWMQSEG